MTSIDEYHTLKSGSEGFLDSAEYQLDKGYFTVASSSFHRSLEFIHGVEYPRTHCLKSLIEIIANATGKKCSVTARELLDTYIMDLHCWKMRASLLGTFKESTQGRRSSGFKGLQRRL